MTEAPSTTPPANELASLQVLSTVTGFEEELIEATFGRDLEVMPFGRQLRAMAFLLRHRARPDAAPRELHREVMEMKIHDVFQEFPDLADDPAPGPPAEPVDPAVEAPPGPTDAREALDLCTDAEGCASPVHLSTCPER